MLSSVLKCALLGALTARVMASPVAVHSSDIEILSSLNERTPSIMLGSYCLSTTHENDVLFNLGYGTTSANVGDALHLEVECIDCRTWGTATVTTSGVSKDESIIGDAISFFENPIDTIVSAFDLDVKIEFEDCGGHFEFDIVAADTVSYSFPILESATPVGIACSEEVTVGLILAIDLVFSLTAEIDLEAGFEFSFPEGAYITVDPLGGDIVDQGFTGGQVGHLPITCTSGSATFKAALRVRIQAGTTIEVFGTGFDFELGIYADLIEYVATIGTSDDCELYITESVDVNIGAFAHAVLELDYKTFGASPAVVTTLLDYPLPSVCLTRPVDTGLPTFTTATATPLVSPIAETSTLYLSASYPTVSEVFSTTSTGAIFFQGSSSDVTPTAALSGSVSYTGPILGSATSTFTIPIPTYGDSTITSAPSTTISTVYTTDFITITSCAAAVLHCPAESTSEIVITSTAILYTTVCPVGKPQPTLTPTTMSPSSSTLQPINTTLVIISPLPLTPCPTPIVSTIYTPTFVNPTYTTPTATSFTVLNPNWSVGSSTSSSAAPVLVSENERPSSAITSPPVYSLSPAPSNFSVNGNGTVLATATGLVKVQPSIFPAFTGGAAQSLAQSALGAIVALGFSISVLL